MNYIATYSNLPIIFQKSDIIFRIVLDLSYLLVIYSRSRVGGYNFLGNKGSTNLLIENQTIIHNDLINVKASILRSIISTVSESEIATTFANTKLVVSEYICLLKIRYL